MSVEEVKAEEQKEEAVAEESAGKSQRRRRPSQKQQASGMQEVPYAAQDAAAKSKSEPGVVHGGNVLLFGKYPLNDVKVEDQSISSYIRFGNYEYPNIFGRRKFQSYYNAHISIIERLMNKLMRGGTGKKIGGKVIRTEGRLQGKKLKVMHIVEDSFEKISKKTGKNPVQVFVDAIEHAAPIEDTTRVRYGGISYNVAVGISAQRRVDVALKNIALSAIIGSFNKRKSVADALADELILAATNSSESYAIKKRTDVERIAKRAR